MKVGQKKSSNGNFCDFVTSGNKGTFISQISYCRFLKILFMLNTVEIIAVVTNKVKA